MRLLITNDDGYRAEGLKTLAKRLMLQHDVTVVAPTKSKSGASHSMTFYKDVGVRKSNQFDWECYHVDGTPVDCVRFGAEVVMEGRKPDLILSGINDCANIGTDVLYSGTVQAAVQGNLIGFCAIAISTDFDDKNQYEKVADFVADNLEKLQNVAKHGAVNLNFPYQKEGILGAKLTPIGINLFSDEFVVKKFANGRLKYRLIGEPIDVLENKEDCDVNWFKKGYVTVSVMQNTFHENLEKAKEDFQL